MGTKQKISIKTTTTKYAHRKTKQGGLNRSETYVRQWESALCPLSYNYHVHVCYPWSHGACIFQNIAPNKCLYLLFSGIHL